MNILFLTDIPPCTNFTAGIIVNKWCDFLIEDGHEISFALVAEPSLSFDIPSDKILKIKFLKIPKPREYWNIPKGNSMRSTFGEFRSLIMNNKIAIFDIPKIAKAINEFGKEQKADVVFSLIQGQTLTRLTRKASRGIGVPYVAQCWDPLEWWLRDYGFDKITSTINMLEFAEVAKNARKFASMSWAMSNMFENEYSAKCVTNIPGLEAGRVESKIKMNKNIFKIAFAGQLYAIEEFEVLIKALDLMNWEFNGKKIQLELFGKSFSDKYKQKKNIKIRGYFNQEKLLDELASADLLYCPYWFDRKFEKACRISFPSKLTSYLKTAKPILMHAPEYASPRILLEEYKAAYICDSLDVNNMEKLLRRIISDKTRETVGERGYMVFEKFLTYDQMKKSLFVSLGIMKRKEIIKFESVRKIYER